MGNIQTYILTNTFFVTYAQDHSFKCRLHHTHEGRQIKMACNVPHLYQFIPIQFCNAKKHLKVSIPDNGIQIGIDSTQ